MATRETIRKIIEKYRNIAVYGMSKDPGKTAHWIPEQLASKGYQILCVNPGVDRIEKGECYPDLKSVPKRIDVVLVFRRSEDALEPVKRLWLEKRKRRCLRRLAPAGNPKRGGPELAEENEILFVQDRCMYHEYQMVYLQDE